MTNPIPLLLFGLTCILTMWSIFSKLHQIFCASNIAIVMT